MCMLLTGHSTCYACMHAHKTHAHTAKQANKHKRLLVLNLRTSFAFAWGASRCWRWLVAFIAGALLWGHVADVLVFINTFCLIVLVILAFTNTFSFIFLLVVLAFICTFSLIFLLVVWCLLRILLCAGFGQCFCFFAAARWKLLTPSECWFACFLFLVLLSDAVLVHHL